jgi:hypothetical protein
MAALAASYQIRGITDNRSNLGHATMPNVVTIKRPDVVALIE